jgi:glucose-6-phosphate isomerase
MNNINPTGTNAWKALQNHYDSISGTHLNTWFAEDPDRSSKLTIDVGDFQFDFSRNRITEDTLSLLTALAEETGLQEAIEEYFSGAPLNVTENRAVLHTALRASRTEKIMVNGINVVAQVHEALDKMEGFCEKVISGTWKGYSGKPITDVVNIGIGGSDLGPAMVTDALTYYRNNLNTHFISNIDGDHVMEILKGLNRETTLFIVVSKTFTTQETLTNANTVRKWFLEQATESDVAKHFAAVSTNSNAVSAFGIAPENVFPMWDWVGGRFSLWSPVGLSIALGLGFDNFRKLLQGAREMDQHFRHTDFIANAPVVAALLSVWYGNFFGTETEVILPYSQYLGKLVPYLQQATMESNGKQVDRNGDPVNYQTGAIIWGSPGTNAQHAFMQLLHQGTKLIPSEFIGFRESLYGRSEHHEKLMANYFAQMQALAEGKTREQAHTDLKSAGLTDRIDQLLPFKVFEGNKPSTSVLIDRLTPESLGKLIAYYEHQIFVKGHVWNIYSFDQFGVELGKELANKRLRS